MRSLALPLLLASFLGSGILDSRARAGEVPTPVEQKIRRVVVVDGWASRHFVTEYRREDTKALVLLFLGTECPLVKLYIPTLNEMEKDYRDRGVQFLAVFSNAFEELPAITAYAEETDIPFPVLKDPNCRLADALGVERTPEVVVLDRDLRIQYQGLINDQYRAGGRRPNVTDDYLRVALDEMLAGKPVTQSLTLATGCHIEHPSKSDPRTGLTYNKDIAPLIQKHCQACHRPDQVGPFSLLNYNQVRSHATMIEEVVSDRRMPPWNASSDHKRYGEFVNDRRMSRDEIATIKDWIRSGMPEGDPKDLPPNPTWPQGWAIGEPDLVLEMSEDFDVPADGVVSYKYFKVRTNLKEDRWVQGVEIRPGNASVVHHITVHVAKPRRRNLFGLLAIWSLYGAEGEKARVLGSYAPGAPPILYPEGFSMRLPAGYDLIFEVHYTPIGIPQKDRSLIGLKFAEEPPKNEVKEAWVIDNKMEIPAGDPHYRLENAYTFEKAARLMSLRPHMHLRGKSWRFELIYPDGKREHLMSIPRWDYEWQDLYEFKSPVSVPAGTQLHCVAHWDNSAHNPNNPDPQAVVEWGLQSEDEMMHWRVTYFEEVP